MQSHNRSWNCPMLRLGQLQRHLRRGWLKKAMWSGLDEEAPNAARVLRKIDFSNAQIARAALMVDVDGMAVEEAAAAWMEENPDVVASWLE